MSKSSARSRTLSSITMWCGIGSADTRIEAQGMRSAGYELGGGDGFPTREQGDLMPLLD
jgi:hypothetical protein